jgi:hypothetical protein
MMKTIFSHCRRFIKLGRYKLDNFFVRGVSAQITLLLVLMIAVILLGTLGLPLGLYSPGNNDVASVGHKYGKGFWDAVWWSTMHIFDPSYVSQDYGVSASIIVLALVISMLGLVLFGGVIGLVAAAVGRKLDQLADGNRPVLESGHLLILGWNEKIFNILDLFEDYHKAVTIVIFCNHRLSDMQDRMRTERGRIRRIHPILRTGSPTNLSELERVAFRSAHSIIVLADESNPNPEEEADIGTIKTLMLLARNLPMGVSRPKMVAEVERPENLDVAGIASNRSISLICSSEVLSRMIVQASRQPGLSSVFSSLFGFVANEIFIQRQPGCTSCRFGDSMFDFPNAIPLGISLMEEYNGRPYFRPKINPGKNHIIGEGEWLILLSQGPVVYQPKIGAALDLEFLPPETRCFPHERVLILGWNSKIFRILHEFDTFLQAGSEITIAALHPPLEARAWLEAKLPAPLVNATQSYVQTNYALAGKLDALLSGKFDTCVILADESSGGRDPDARAIVTILLVQDYERRHPDHALKKVVVEVLSAANAELLAQDSKTDTIISPRLISMLLAQVSQQLMLDQVYASLMNARANEIYLKPVDRYVHNPAGCTFADLMRGAAKRGELAIGVKIQAKSNDATGDFGIRLNPPKNEPLSLVAADELIVISRASG